MAQFQAFAIEGFVIRRSRFPATKDDTDPLERECAKSGMMRLSTFAQLLVAGSSPFGFKDGAGGKLMEGLPQEFGTGQAPVNPNTSAAFFSDWSDARELLYFCSELKAAA